MKTHCVNPLAFPQPSALYLRYAAGDGGSATYLPGYRSVDHGYRLHSHLVLFRTVHFTAAPIAIGVVSRLQSVTAEA
jgi:hypothetical protein